MKNLYLKLLIFLSGNNLYTQDEVEEVLHKAINKTIKFYEVNKK